MMDSLRILLAEDNEDDAGLIEHILRKSGMKFTCRRVTNRAGFIRHLEEFLPNVILSDHSMYQFSSTEALAIYKKENLTIPFILVTGTVSEEFAVECLKRGADDYILKGNLTRLPSAINNALRQRKAESEKHIAIEMLKRSEEHFRKLIENSSDIFAIIKSNRTMEYLSPSVERILGYKPNELRNKNAFDFIHENDREEAEKLFIIPLGDKGLASSEFRFKHKNGYWKYLECISKPDSLGDNTILNIRDVTERKKTEEELRSKNKELEKINRELDSFVYSASHDLRAPLKSLLGLVKLTQLEFKQNTLDSFEKYTELMEKSIKKLDDTIQKVVYHSSNSRLEIKGESINLKEIVEEIFDKLVYMEGNSLIEKKLQLQEECDFVTDKGRFTVIMNNLISNGIKYSNTLKENPFISISISVTPQEATIVFEDNGIGIEEEFVNKVFNMFFRATERSEGSGLGLYIVREIVDKLGGKIEVKSKLNEGTTFIVKIPNQYGK